MTRDRGYPDWLILSARLLAQPLERGGPRCNMYVLFMFLIDYVKILQPVAICAIIFVTPANKGLYIRMHHGIFSCWRYTAILREVYKILNQSKYTVNLG